MSELLAPRLRRLPVVVVLAHEVRLASGIRARLLGLAHLDREQAGCGLFIPRCSSVHTFGMRFPLDLYFVDASGGVVAIHGNVERQRVVACRGASAVLEIPPAEGGENLPLGP